MPAQQRADKTYNIKVRITHAGTVRYVATQWYVKPSDLNSKGEIKNRYYIDKCEDLLNQYRTELGFIGVRANYMTADELVEQLNLTQKRAKPFALDFVAYTRAYMEKLMAQGKDGTARNYRSAINSLVSFAGCDQIDISQITTKFLQRWIDNLANPIGKNAKSRNRAPGLYVQTLKAMHNRAKKEFNDEDSGYVPICGSPFLRIELPRIIPPRKRALTLEEIRAIINYKPPTEFIDSAVRATLARDAFLLSFMLVGMNAADLYNATDFDGERITYQRTKTKDRRADRAEISIKVEPEVMALLKKYRDPKGERIFKFYKRYANVNNLNHALNKGLKIIGENLGIEDLEFYAARHSWATIAVNEVGIDKYTVHEALNHVDPAMRVTDMYIKKSWKNIDIANRKVLDYVFGVDSSEVSGANAEA